VVEARDTNELLVFQKQVVIKARVETLCGYGSSSDTGTNFPLPCTLCPYGTFANDTGLDSCYDCPDNYPFTEQQGEGDTCVECPLGYYCPIGSHPQPCPKSGGYESLARYHILTVPCADGWWCGTAAAEDQNYVQFLTFDPLVVDNVLTRQTKHVTLLFTSLMRKL
jgi:hypothetical protein